MTAGKMEQEKPFRIWPGILFPACLTLVLAGACWSFAAKVEGDQDRADADSLHLESRARMEANELALAADGYAKAYIESRKVARANQERNLRLEVRGVMDAVYRLLTAGLDKSRNNTASRRDVGRFPPGFEGVRSFLEIAPSDPESDEAVQSLRACSPELASLLPSGCSLAVIEDSSRELLSIGGGVPPEGSVTEAMTRDFLFDDGRTSRHWTLRVELNAPDAHPAPTAAEAASVISERIGDRRFERIAWRGWLIGPDGSAAASFPASASGAADAPPFIDMPGEWVEIDGRRLVWLERPRRSADSSWTPAVAVAIDRPAPPLQLAEELMKDRNWQLFLGAMTLLSLAGWVWFVRLLALSGRSVPDEPERKRDETRVRRRLVRDEHAERLIPEVQGVIVADIGDDGQVRLRSSSTVVPPAAARKPATMPSGSLYRLQGIHRGREGMRGSRILDQARSPVLRELANRVRPAAASTAEGSKGRKAHGSGSASITGMKSPLGWNKVEE